MKAKFELRTWLTENRETIVNNYTKLTAETYFSGISLKDFMIATMNALTMNNVKSEKTATSKLPFLMANVYCANSKVGGINWIDEKSDKARMTTGEFQLVYQK